jgi:hypothetical protein
MVFAPAAGHLPATRKEYEIRGAVPLFDHVEALVDLTAQRFRVQIPAEEDRLDGLSQFGEGLVGGVRTGSGKWRLVTVGFRPRGEWRTGDLEVGEMAR